MQKLEKLSDIHNFINSSDYCIQKGKKLKSDYSYHFQNTHEINSDFIKHSVLKNGFLVIQMEQNPSFSKVKSLQKIFGAQIKHGEKKRYICKVENIKHASSYFNTTFSQPLHTDSGHENRFPRFVSLYCVRSAEQSGLSIIVKANELLDALHKKFNKNDILNLFDPNFIKIDGKNGRVHKQILFHTKDNKVGISYTPVLRNLETTKLGTDLIEFMNTFIHNPKNQYRISLKKNDLLIIDNCQVLHGRTAFKESDC